MNGNSEQSRRLLNTYRSAGTQHRQLPAERERNLRLALIEAEKLGEPSLVGLVYFDLGQLYFKQKDMVSAELNLKFAIFYREQFAGPTDYVACDCLSMLGLVHAALGRVDEAYQCLLDSLLRTEQDCGANSAKTIERVAELARFLRKVKRNAEAGELEKRIRQSREDNF
jgi:tetratricopeptide (TPR) repeat protein